MDNEDRGWPLEKEAIRAKYYALVKRDMERKVLKAKCKTLAYDHMLQQIPVHLTKSKSTREAYSRARSLQRVLRRAGLADTSGKGSQSVPVSSPSSVARDSGATSSSHQSRGTSHHGVIPRVNLATSSAPNAARVQKNGKQTKFLAKQFKLISNNANAAPRRNIKILAKDPSEVVFVAEEMERDQLQERIRAHDCDKSDPSNSTLRLDALSDARKMSQERHLMDGHAHANSPSSVISEAVSVSETDMSSVENESSDHLRLTSFSMTRERWTSREIFGSFDFGGELDIVAGSVAEAAPYPESSGYDDQDRFSSCLDESGNSPISGMRSPRQSYATSSQGGATDHGHLASRGGVEQRMKVTSLSSLFRDGPQSSPNAPRKLSRKLSSKSFNKRRKQGMIQSHPESLSTRSQADKKAFDHGKTSSLGSLTLQIAGLISGYRLSQVYGKSGMQEAAVNAFQEEIAQLMMDHSESNEIGDIEEFLDGYMRLRSPFYLEVVEEFFRTVSYDCYKRPLQVKKLAPKVPKVPKAIQQGLK